MWGMWGARAAMGGVEFSDGWEAEFWARVRKGAEGDCWVWQGARAKFRQQSAPRIAYRLRHGSVPDDVKVFRRCGNRLCVNPDHLFTRLKRGGDVCRNGHPYSPANTYVSPAGERYCRECRRDWERVNAAPRPWAKKPMDFSLCQQAVCCLRDDVPCGNEG